MNRCRLALKAIFLSDIATADGRHLEHWVLGNRQGRSSSIRFPREQPCAADWDLWDSFWFDWVRRDGTLPVTLGKWINNTHQQWQWFYETRNNVVWEQTTDGWLQYAFSQEGRSTRGNQKYVATGLWQQIETRTLQSASVFSEGAVVQLIDTGPALATKTNTTHTGFWDYVMDQGGTWMWESIEGKHDDMSWLVHALQGKTAMMVTDGSYNRPVAPTISGAGWVLVCTKQRKMIRSSFYEQSPSASSYQGELLGLTAIHHLVAHAMEYYNCNKATGSVHCDNKGALRQASLKRRRVHTITKHSDLIRNLRYLKNKYNFEVEYIHVKAHQDDIHAYEDLPLVQQLNVMCDSLAKLAVQSSFGFANPRNVMDQLLPCEQAAIIVDNVKLTTDVATEVRFSLGTLEARWFFTKPVRMRRGSNVGGLGWTHGKFDCVDWRILHNVLTSKPDMYGVWVSKQTVGACATRRALARIQGSDDDRCPNCLIGPERHTHLNQCQDQGRSHVFEKDVEDLHMWLCRTMDAKLRYWIRNYLCHPWETFHPLWPTLQLVSTPSVGSTCCMDAFRLLSIATKQRIAAQ